MTARKPTAEQVLNRFGATTREWFTGAFDAPTAAQVGAWDAVSGGNNALVVAPTGSGKTLAAFLWALDRLAREPRPEGGSARTRVLYISPLKALAVDVERNLRAPRSGMIRTATANAQPIPDITVGIRSGDTPPATRRALIRTPPDILITTPESLFLMLTSSARETLTDVHTVIVDEIHAIAGTKRGSHLALSLERLDQLSHRNDADSRLPQRIGLSATVRPVQKVADFLSPTSPCVVVNPHSDKHFDLSVDVPVPDITDIRPDDLHDGSDDSTAESGSLWPYVESAIVDLIERSRSTLVFANSRRLAERLTARINEIHATRLGQPGRDQAPPNPRVPGGAPAVLMASDASYAGADVIARAHHGSVSKEHRSTIEDDLKSGRLRCVVATSSLELGIDMGLVDLVIQVESPPSIASGLQRVGRAGHQVGQVSRGVFFPKHRVDVLHCSVAVRQMLQGRIEHLAIPENALDILAQHTVSAAAMGPLQADDWYALVCASAPYRNLPRSAFDAVLDLLAGKYPSDEFAELRPRIVWDRTTGTITGRPGSQRLAVTSGGAIPDRGMFGVFLVGERRTRVGELDEEMVYESRVGDIFALGASSWRIEEITHDQVLVSPAVGAPGRLPFWIGDTLGRPYEFGCAIGEFTRTTVQDTAVQDTAVQDRDDADPTLTSFAADNLHALLDDQRQATGHLPTDRTLVVERFRDELGDWRVILHSPFGLRVHRPWASVIDATITENLGIDGAVTAADDGIIVRLPDTDDEPPGAAVFATPSDDIDDAVASALYGSALFAARFRECAARALLLPRRTPGRRAPLWQQRQRSAQLLGVATKYPSFPIILEAMRECLNDVYDLPALRKVLTDVEQRRIRVVEVETTTASPFAASLMFGYIGSVMYDEDTPLAERRSAALSLDTDMLAALLGRVDLRELLDVAIVADVEDAVGWLRPDRHARSVEALADMLRSIGPLTEAEVALRCDVDDVSAALAELHTAARVLTVRYGDQMWWAAVEDAPRLRDALGIPLPQGIPATFTEPVADPLGDLVSRYARSHGPFSTQQVADRLRIGTAVIEPVLADLARQRRVVRGEFTSTDQWCDAQVLKRIRHLCLSASRSEVAPVPPERYAQFLLQWQHVEPGHQLSGIDGVMAVIDQLAGIPLAASVLESSILPSRVPDYTPQMLDELTISGDVLWRGRGRNGANDGWICVAPADRPELLVGGAEPMDDTPLHHAVMQVLGSGGGFFLNHISSAVADLAPGASPADVARAVMDLCWSGHISNDTLGPVRVTRRHRRPARAVTRRRPSRYRFDRSQIPSGQPDSPAANGRWFALSPSMPHDSTPAGSTVDDSSLTETLAAQAGQLLDRCGVVTKGSVTNAGIPGGFHRMYKVLSEFEDFGRVRRGYFIDGLGGAQFAHPSIVDRLRAPVESGVAVVLAATDPANPYGAALRWPPARDGSSRHRPGRKAGALVVLVDGRLAAFIERGGKTVVTWPSDIDESPAIEESRCSSDDFTAAAHALARAVTSNQLPQLTVVTIDGLPAVATEFGQLLEAAGFSRTPQGLRLRPSPGR